MRPCFQQKQDEPSSTNNDIFWLIRFRFLGNQVDEITQLIAFVAFPGNVLSAAPLQLGVSKLLLCIWVPVPILTFIYIYNHILQTVSV